MLCSLLALTSSLSICYLLSVRAFATVGFVFTNSHFPSTLETRMTKGKAVTKADLVDDVARASELTKKDAETLVEIVFDCIVNSLNHGEKIELRGFGSFRVRSRNARRGRNPKTGEPVDIEAKRIPYFKPGKELKELINEEKSGVEEVRRQNKSD